MGGPNKWGGVGNQEMALNDHMRTKRQKQAVIKHKTMIYIQKHAIFPLKVISTGSPNKV